MKFLGKNDYYFLLNCLLQGLDFVIDGGIRAADPSTVVDMSENIPTIIRKGKV